MAINVYAALSPIWNENGACGKSKYPDAGDYFLPAPTIVGGIEARPNEFPWQVSVQTKKGTHSCGGSIINSKWIITAAHCLDENNPGYYMVVVGLHKKITGAGDSTVKVHDVERIVVHEMFSPITVANDIALIKVKNDIKLDENVNTVCAPKSNDQYAHYKTVVSGWGNLAPGGSNLNVDSLMYTTLNTTAKDYCLRMYKNIRPITDDMICASDNKGNVVRDSCQMDSGGPLVNKEKDGTFRLVGVVSWGIGCASKYPGVYARVNHFEDWILKNIKL
ncbi:hypothetical protein HELRODRAFT_178982 [Helobdella robusta]|uniref:Peptidase S1 domain-containing protein n=1 Tax=Helobdella robusta TaxID=6412 RepID=T1FE04_HELRO|nr:hypothetical protein HELRODRAFT_178982 [Helobdella robusta]ESN95799.1 hypothetical protein HELRODRAFT_178982 [Helobdella robusta]